MTFFQSRALKKGLSERIVIQFPSVHTSSTGYLKAFFRRANSVYEELSRKKLIVGGDVIQRFCSLKNCFEAEVVSCIT